MMINGLSIRPRAGYLFVLLAGVLALQPALAGEATPGNSVARAKATKGKADIRPIEGRYIVVLDAPALPVYLSGRQGTSLQSGTATAPRLRPDLQSPEAVAYLSELDNQYEMVRELASTTLGREVHAIQRFQLALNGFVAEFSDTEAKQLAKLPGVASIQQDSIIRKQTYAGPEWIGARPIWEGQGSLPSSRGEGVVVGIIDSGANWGHVSFDDPSSGPFSYNHSNPYGQQLGLCSDPEVQCNDKLVGVYDFVQDLANTEVVEENTKGRDNGQHGAHVASTVAGNPVTVTLFGSQVELSGVAPNANIVSYRVCFAGDPDDPDDDGCINSQIVQAINQAIEDEVDVINMSLGGGQFSSWVDNLALAYLNAYSAGIFVATSASNAGPADGSINNPANAPWMFAVGSATHDRIFGNTLSTLSGGNTPPPGALNGASLTQEGIGRRTIVHARDFGNALCGVGPAELASTCAENTGASNPFPAGTFNGEIVVCDRGTYGRIEKGKNLQLAGAGGFVLANTQANGAESIESDRHCLPTTHLGANDGDKLRTWLDSGTAHEASISAASTVSDDQFADRLSGFSSRGPNLAPAEDILKPNVIAPGDLIWAASNEGDNTFVGLGGTSMSSPHAAGAAVLLSAIRPNWTPAMIASALQLTATNALATDENGVPATRLEVGHGRIRVDEAARAGLYLNETGVRFQNAGPGGSVEPRDLNLPSMTDAGCAVECSFTRTLRPLVAGRTWTASVEGFPAGVEVTVAPQQFTLGAGAQQTITVDVDLSGFAIPNTWLSGDVVLRSSGLPDAVMPVTVQSTNGELPELWTISSDRNSGSETFSLGNLAALPQASFAGYGFAEPELTVEELVEDPTFADPYDGGDGVYTLLLDVPPNTLILSAALSAPIAEDLDLYVGRDLNRNGRADLAEQRCVSGGFDSNELCEILEPSAGGWWILVQNYENGVDPATPVGPAMETRLLTTVVSAGSPSPLHVAGPGMTDAGENFDLMLSWDAVSVRGGQDLLGAVLVSSRPDAPGDIGIIPVRFQRTGIASTTTTILHPGREQGFALAPGQVQNRLVVDVPPGATSLAISVDGATSEQNNNLELQLRRRSFANSFAKVPEVMALPGGIVATEMGMGGNGPELIISGGDLSPGRWYAVVTNTGNVSADVRVTANLEYDGSPPLMRFGSDLWQPALRDIGQGVQYVQIGGSRGVAWYTYDDQGQPTWYLAADSNPQGNVWTADVQRFTNDGTEQQSTVVGTMSMTMLSEEEMVFSWSLLGEHGSDLMMPSFQVTTCPDLGDGPLNYSGIWTRLPEGKGGASIAMNANVQAQTHYIYDADGVPRWLLAPAAVTEESFDLLQFSGFCPTCSGSIDNQVVGTLTRLFESESSGGWLLDYDLAAPLSSVVDRSDMAMRLSGSVACE
jgi:subtilisin family serine protease